MWPLSQKTLIIINLILMILGAIIVVIITKNTAKAEKSKVFLNLHQDFV